MNSADSMGCDGTGETANRMFKAAMLQFSEDVFITRHANVRDKKQIREIFKRTLSDHVLVVYTFVSDELRKYTRELAKKQGAHSIDVLGSTMETLSTLFHKSPVAKPGLLHRVDEEYYARVSAIEFSTIPIIVMVMLSGPLVVSPPIKLTS